MVGGVWPFGCIPDRVPKGLGVCQAPLGDVWFGLLILGLVMFVLLMFGLVMLGVLMPGLVMLGLLGLVYFSDFVFVVFFSSQRR